MQNKLWNAISNLRGCKLVTPPKSYAPLFLLKTKVDKTGWLVGPYRDMTWLATDLRTDKALRDFLEKNRVRLGLRETDVPPEDIERQEGYGTTVRGEHHDKDFSGARRDAKAQAVSESSAASVSRKTDREANVKSFWDSQTPQSHHIVEFNNLKKLGASRSGGEAEMDYLQLPTVLLAAEFHQRYISAVLRPAQHWGAEGLRSEIAGVYRKLYLGRSELFEPLWRISQEILRRAGDIPGI